MTYTFVALEVSPAVYDEIAAKLREAQYDHAFVSAPMDWPGLAIDMHGIALVRVPDEKEQETIEAAVIAVLRKEWREELTEQQMKVIAHDVARRVRGEA